MTEEYKYQVDEKSLTQDFLIKALWIPIVKMIPARVTPNTITVCGAMFMLLSIVCVWMALAGRNWGYLGAAFCVFAYMTADNIDGTHARRTGQSSRLGEFLDHWLDSINMIVINMSVLLCLQFSDWLMVIVTAGMALAFFATLWEHHHTGIFHSGRMGTNEGLLMVIGLDVVLFFMPKNAWIIYQGPTEPSFALVFAYLTSIVCVVTTAKTVLRVHKKMGLRQNIGEFVPFVLAIVAIVAITSKGMDKRLAALGILSLNALFCGPFLLGRLAKRASSFRKWAIPFAAIAFIALVFTPYIEALLKTKCGLYVGGVVFVSLIVWDLGRAIAALGEPKKDA